MRFERRKSRNFLASIVYKLSRFLPLSKTAKLDLLLDLAWVSNRLSLENAGAAGIDRRDANSFLHNGIKPSDRVLDVGCASGDILAGVNAAERVGIDYDADLIEQAQKKHPGVKFVAGEAREYLEAAGAFDVLILSHVLEHIDEPERFLSSLKGRFGRIYVEVPDLDWTDLNRVRIARKRKLIYTDDDHVAEFNRDELEEIFEELNYSVIDSEFRYGVMRYWISS